MFSYNYTFNVEFGCGAIQNIGRKMKEMNCAKALICCDEGIVKFGMLEKLTSVLEKEEINYIVYDKVVPNPLESNVTEACAMAKEAQVDCFIAIGGGSSIDTAKAASILLENKRLIQEDITQFPKPGLPVIAIPTTAGTGSDMSIGAMISNDQTHAKMAVPTPTATLSICDPEFTRTLPKGATVVGAVDALMHAIEGYTSVKASKYSDLICENCIGAVAKYLPAVLENGEDMRAREELMFAASSCGTVIATSYLHAGHAIGHALGGSLNLVHGIAVAVVAPQLLKILAQEVPEKTKRIGELLGVCFPENIAADEISNLLSEKMIQLLRSWGIKNLKEMGYELDSLYACIPTILGDMTMYLAPRPLTADDVKDILQVAYTF